MFNILKNNNFLCLFLIFISSFHGYAAVVDNSVTFKVTYQEQTKEFSLLPNMSRDSFIRQQLRKEFNITDLTQDLILSLDGISMNLNEHGMHPAGTSRFNDYFLEAAKQVYGRPLMSTDNLTLTLQPKKRININLLSKISDVLTDVRSTINFEVNAPIRKVYDEIITKRNIDVNKVESIILVFNDKEFNLTQALKDFRNNCFSCKAAHAFGKMLKDGDQVEIKVNKKP